MVNTQGLSVLVKKLSNNKYEELNKFINIKYKELNNKYINNSALFNTYTTIKDYLYSYVPQDEIPDTVEFPSNVFILDTGVNLKDFLIMTIKRTPLYVGTDNPIKMNPFKNKIQSMINRIKNEALYTVSINSLTMHKTTKLEFKEFLKNLNIKYA